MKNLFLKFSINSIKSKYPDIEDSKLAEIKYGLEGFYLSVSKLIVLIMISILLKIEKEMFIMLLIFNILRITGFGLHASKSWICLTISLFIFILFPFLSKLMRIPLYIKFVLSMLAIVLAYLYSPADTRKRPLINSEKRHLYKIITTLNTCLLCSATIVVSDNTLSNLIIFGVYCEILIILPITYKLFNFSYNNFKNYKLSMK